MVDSSELPDLQAIDRGLKDFQQHTAIAAFEQLYQREASSRRFLIADEVGLGKTLIARAVIARALHHLWRQVRRIDVLYICSNADIARQNIKRLNVLGREDAALPTRITLLPIQLPDLEKHRINFISLTPSTSFDLKSNLGRQRERILLYWLLQPVWKFSGRAPMNVFQGGATAEHFRRKLTDFPARFPIERTVQKAFRSALQERICRERSQGERTLRQRFKWLCEQFHRQNARSITREAKQERSRFIGDLRNLLAESCVQVLEPDLIILDEFQRFKHLLTDADDASLLAKKLFAYSDETSNVRVLLLSATPYKMYTLSEESETDDHYSDFIATLGFLFNDSRRTQEFQVLLREFRHEVLRLDGGATDRLEEIKAAMETRLRTVMARTERLAVSSDRDGMLTEIAPRDVQLAPEDLLAYCELQRVAHELALPDTTEYWKSSSYLLNFMEDYKLKQSFRDALTDGARRAALSRALTGARHLLLSWQAIEQYRRIDPRNARLRGLLNQTVESEWWKLLWLPPALPYYPLEGPFAELASIRLTKRLVFSSWRVVPKVISTILSFEAERRAVQLQDAQAVNTPEEREKRAFQLLRITVQAGRLTGMPVLALMYPSTVLTQDYDPLALTRAWKGEEPISLASLRRAIVTDLSRRLLPIVASYTGDGRIDEQWYWAAPILLDAHYEPEATADWFASEDLASRWSGGEGGPDHAWVEHVQRARDAARGRLELGRPPEDLAHVLADLALAGPAICTLRAFGRATTSTIGRNPVARTAAAATGWAFRSLFNRPEVASLLRGLKPLEPYWRRILDYCAEGGLQAVMDEYVHVLKDSRGLLAGLSDNGYDELAQSISEALTMRASVLAVDDIRVADGRLLDPITQRFPSRFAMPFGRYKDDEGVDTVPSRGQKVREAFNSPFWPFVLTSTSVGQEGLDFHWYCHAVVHWNLPANPVDLEQREGRVHRYKGHAVRKNLAARHAHAVFESAGKDPWDIVFDQGRKTRRDGESDLVPFWIYPLDNGAKIERYVPSLPLTRDRQLLEALRRSLAVYRMVFGQPRQEDLVRYLLRYVPQEELHSLVERLRIDLTPPSGNVRISTLEIN